MTTANKPDVILLKYSGGYITVEPKDEDRFVISANKAVEACLNQHHADEVIKHFKKEFLHPLRKWCENHASKVFGCYVPPPKGLLEVFVVGTAAKYDFDLGRELSKLELELYDAGWRVNVLQLPKCDDDNLRSYFNPDGAIVVYGQSERASGESEGQPEVPQLIQ
jgi:hypothetical protein